MYCPRCAADRCTLTVGISRRASLPCPAASGSAWQDGRHARKDAYWDCVRSRDCASACHTPIGRSATGSCVWSGQSCRRIPARTVAVRCAGRGEDNPAAWCGSGGLASPPTPLRTVLVDSRAELCYGTDDPGLCAGCAGGISPGAGSGNRNTDAVGAVILCDEIGDCTEAMALVEAHHGGVPLVASAHAADCAELLHRTGLRLLHERACSLPMWG